VQETGSCPPHSGFGQLGGSAVTKRLDSDESRTAVLQNIRSLVDFLRRHSPFNAMSEPDLIYLVEHSRLAFYAAGEEILTPAAGRVDRYYIVKQGQIRGERPEADGSISTPFVLGPGESFPVSALVQERATRTVHRAVADTFCLEVDWDTFTELFDRSGPFQDFCLRGASSLLDRVSRRTQRVAAEQLGAQNLLNGPLSEVIARAPVTCSPDTTIRAAIMRMHAEKVGSIVICDAEQRPLGIFTLHDLLAMLTDPQAELDRPIAGVMTPDPVSLPADARGFEAAITMVRHRFGHICVLDGERLVGVVSERDLFALQRVDLAHLTRLIARADGIAELAAIRPQIGRLIDAMLAHGADTTLITHIITLLNDHTTQRVIDLCIEAHGRPDVDFTWIAFGSEGRREQTLSTDQDNGILFHTPPGMSDEQVRARLLPLATRINEALAQCGFPLCKGNIMASNPELCLSEAEWRNRFRRMINSATPKNLLRSTIYFDLRPIWGDPEPVQALYRQVVSWAARDKVFLRLLAADALRAHPPLGLFRDFLVQRDDNNQETLDLKLQGLSLIVDAARVLALANRIAEPETLKRLDLAAAAGAITQSNADAWKEAFGLIQLLRMRSHRAQGQQGLPLSNRLDPGTLHEIDRRSLKEAFRQIRRLQRRLELNYQL